MNNKALRNRKKSTVDNDALVGSLGEVVIIPEESTIAIHDGVNPGGTRLSIEDADFTSVHKHADATQAVPGFMTAADKTKLDNLSAQALPAASSQNNPNTLVKRDGNGDFAANVITADVVGDVTGSASSISGNLTGDVTSSGMATTLSATGVAAGTYGSSTTVPRIVVDAKGRISNAQNIAIAGGGASGAAGGDLGGTYPNPTVETVGSKSKAAIAQAVVDTVNATSVGTASTLAKRDASGKLQSALSVVGDAAATLVTKSYVDAFSGGSKNVAVFRRNESTSTQEVSINGSTFTSVGASAFTVPVSVGWFGLIAIGAGGGGTGGASVSGGSGGGAGACIYAEGVPVTPGASLTIAVGAGGAGSNGVNGSVAAASNGGATSISGAGLFMGTITAQGGQGGQGGTNTSAGVGASALAGLGTALNFDVNGIKYLGGYAGAASSANVDSSAGSGGTSFSAGTTATTGTATGPSGIQLGFGPGKAGNGGQGGTHPASNGTAGEIGAGGGGGGKNGTGGSYANGARGGHGLVVIFY